MLTGPDGEPLNSHFWRSTMRDRTVIALLKAAIDMEIRPDDKLICVLCKFVDFARVFVPGPFWGGDEFECPKCGAGLKDIRKEPENV